MTVIQYRRSLVWCLVLFQSRPSRANARRYTHYGSSSFTRLGRIPLGGRQDQNWSRRSGGWSLPAVVVMEPDQIEEPLEDEDTWGKIRPSSVRVRRPSPSPPLHVEESTPAPVDVAAKLTVPIVPVDAWEASTGQEWQDEALVDQLAKMGQEMCQSTVGQNPWVEWNPHKDTEKLLQERSAQDVLQEGEVLVYVGKAKQEGQGSQLPMIQTQSLLPLTAKDMADLLMDSSKVTIYNKMSLGRKDVKFYNENTKVVCNLTKPPVAKSQMVSVTLMHQRELDSDGDRSRYLVVTRAVPGMVDPSMSDLPRNDILLGVNLLEDIDEGRCRMTAITHVYSPALPKLLAKSMGVSSAINFIKDIRNSCELASVPN